MDLKRMDLKRMDLEKLVIKKGWQDKERDTVALLYDEAFGQKLGLAIPNQTRRRKVLAASFQPEYSLVACYNNQIIGVAGFHSDGGSLTSGMSYAELTDILGFWAGNRAALVSYIYSRRPAAKELLMDGIAVHADFRGKGIGSLLLDKLLQFAAENDYNKVRLDVIDTNPKAQKLYQQKGFKTVKTEHFPHLKWLFGFSGSTTMHYCLE